MDPELADRPASPGPVASPPPVANAASPERLSEKTPPSSTEARFLLSLHTRWGVDTNWAHESQDVAEGTTVAVFEAEQRRSESLLLSLGLRARHVFAERQNGEARYELDVVPTSAFADARLDEGLHLRAGYQTVSMGRFDVFSASNFLAAYDLRSGPVTMPEASEVGQPALRFDMDRVAGFVLQTWFLPFFQQNIVTAYGSDYALLAPLDRAIDESGNAGAAAFRRALEDSVGRSGLNVASSAALRALGPEPSLAHPQGAIRATVHGTAGEMSVTVGTALERLPAITFSRSFSEALARLGASGASLPTETIRVAYNRFSIASLDGALDVGPFQLGAEAAFMKNRTLLAASTATPTPAVPNGPVTLPPAVPEQVDMVYGGLRAELLESAGWAAVIEAFITGTLSEPSPPAAGEAPRQWMAFENGRYFRGIAAGVHFAPEESRIRVELGGVVLSGPTYVALPRFEWEMLERFYVELGAVFVEGTTPGFFGTPNVSLGGLYDDVDQVFLGLRWIP